MIKIGMAFGVFDGFHDGHKHFLTRAAEQCEQLIVVLTQDNMVRQLKNISPKFSYTERAEMINAHNPAWSIVPSDPVIGQWQVFKNHNPEVVFLGHDQLRMAEALKAINMSFIFIDAHEPDKYKSSLLLQRSE